MNGFDIHRSAAVARKEVMHIMRDPFTLVLVMGLPVLLVVFFGFAIDFDVKNLKLAVYDRDNSRVSRQLVSVFDSSGYFIPSAVSSPSRAITGLDSDKFSAALLIEPGFGRDVGRGALARAQFVADGTDNSKAMAVLGYLPGISEAALRKFGGVTRSDPVPLKARYMYNAELNSRWFVIPGLAVIIIGLLSILMTALTVAREWENGSMELLLSTPLKPAEIIAGKIAPYVVLILGGVLFVNLVARFGFGVPFRGGIPLFLGGTLLFIVSALSQGIVISVVTRQQQLAMQLSMISGLLPSLLLSGFIFPIESMPVFFRYFTMILSPRWFMEIARGITIRGAGAADLAVPLLALAALSAALLAAAFKKFKRDLEP
ncbi:MAG: ABC transporter permease [Elusimicrobia bacterium CG08_land_8_20_14_0_20_51_18]|nr:MAG: ABC transporter permease [Elusimicrobia bacterium CG08_land_8_20_14_0_20_51_18]